MPSSTTKAATAQREKSSSPETILGTYREAGVEYQVVQTDDGTIRVRRADDRRELITG